MESYDVIVVGAGPAGSTVAFHLVKAGFKVALVDQRKKIGTPKQCGEAITGHILEELGINVKPNWISRQTNSVFVGSPGKGGVTVWPPDSKGYVLDRKIFDEDLAFQAQDAGAKLMLGNKFISFENQHLLNFSNSSILNGRIIIGADGPLSQVRKFFGFSPFSFIFGLQYEIKTEIENPDTLRFFLSKDIVKDGYAWLFPKAETLNIGLGSTSIMKLKPILGALVKQLDLNKKRVLEVNGGLIPLTNHIVPCVKDNVLLVGDAAGHANPLTGGGIPMALFDGQLAAKTVISHFEKKMPLNTYQHTWSKSEFGNAMKGSIRVRPGVMKKLNGGAYDNYFKKIGFVEARSKNDIFDLLKKSVPLYPHFVKLWNHLHRYYRYLS